MRALPIDHVNTIREVGVVSNAFSRNDAEYFETKLPRTHRTALHFVLLWLVCLLFKRSQVIIMDLKNMES